MKYVVQRPAIPKAYIDMGTMEKTVKLSCRKMSSTSDVVMLLSANGISAEEVLGMYRGPPSDSAHYVILSSDEAIARLRSGNLCYRDKQFVFAQLGKQVLTVRVHWLPLYFADTLIKAALRDYGTVLSVDCVTSQYGKTDIKNGMRIVQLEVDEMGAVRVAPCHQFRLWHFNAIDRAGAPAPLP